MSLGSQETVDFNDEWHDAVSAGWQPIPASPTYYDCCFESVLIEVETGLSDLRRERLEADISDNLGAVHRLRRGLSLRSLAQNHQWPHALRIHR